jgi:inorganic pyrophosphatase
MMEDESGMDEKIVAVPNAKVDKSQKHINDIKDLPELFVKSIVHYFEHYKDLEDGKWVKIGEIKGAIDAKKIIQESINNKK